jgi:hypothetical protein
MAQKAHQLPDSSGPTDLFGADRQYCLVRTAYGWCQMPCTDKSYGSHHLSIHRTWIRAWYVC